MIEVIINCDLAACEAMAAARTIADVKRGAKAGGWTIRKDGKTFCPKHLSETTARCEGCGKETVEPFHGRLYADAGIFCSLPVYCDDCCPDDVGSDSSSEPALGGG